MSIANASVAPSVNPAGAGIVYFEDGAFLCGTCLFEVAHGGQCCDAI